MMRSDEHNRHVHGSYAEETAPSLNVNVTDEDESKLNHCAQNFIGKSILGRKRIRMQHRPRKFISEQFIIRTN